MSRPLGKLHGGRHPRLLLSTVAVGRLLDAQIIHSYNVLSTRVFIQLPKPRWKLGARSDIYATPQPRNGLVVHLHAMFRSIVALAFFASTAFGVQSPPTVKLDQATVLGVNAGFNDQFLGIPFAQAP